MLKAFKYRLYPTNSQISLIEKHIGSCRFVYNLALETKTSAYAGNKVFLSRFDLNKQLPELKNELTWLKEVNSQSLQASISNLDNAFTNFFKGRANFPKFKSKRRDLQSFSIPQKIKVRESKLFIPKFKGGIKIVLHRPLKGVVKSATVSRNSSNKYFVSILCDTGCLSPHKPKIAEGSSVGIDLGIKTFIVTSNGTKYDNPRFLLQAESKLKYTQRKYSKYKGLRTKHRLSVLHESVANKRKDFLNKTSIELIRDNQTVCIEDLNISGMIKNRRLSKSISDVGWGMFVNMLEYKAEWYGKNLLKIGRFDPSSKMCSNCGSINSDLTLKDREWVCPSCGSMLNRDINAAINIKSFALKKYLTGEHSLKNQGELPTLVGAMNPEAARFK